jgi:Membrane protein putatively involved in post-translational modification of the autoinducing quorum-sensing peptide
VSNYIIEKLVNKNYIKKDSLESYQYGLEVLIMNLIPIFLIIGISLMIKKLDFGILFLVSFVPIRINIGGYHCKKVQNCIITFIFLYILIVYLANSVLYRTLRIIGFICISFLYCFKPITYDVIENIEINYVKAKSKIKNYCFIILLVIHLFNKAQVIIAIYMSCILNVFLYLIGYVDLRYKRGII